MADTNYSHASWEDGPPPAWVKDHREYQDSILFSEDRDHGTT
jgi:hypothetical protein